MNSRELFDVLDRRPIARFAKTHDRARGIIFRSIPISAAPAQSDGGLTILASDASIDRVGDVIEPAGWKLDNYQRNPVWLVNHDYQIESIVGRGLNSRIESRGLVLDFAPDPAESSESTSIVLAKLKSGSLRGVSVGFRALKYEERKSASGKTGIRFLESELLEVSFVAIPANPNAGRASVTSALGRRVDQILANMRAGASSSGPSRSAVPVSAADRRKLQQAIDSAVSRMRG